MSTKQYLSHDTIHALATPLGGALAVVRMSGPAAKTVLLRLTAGRSAEQKERETFRTRLSSGAKTLDDAMAVYFNGPRSHTGEDVVELFLHGGTVVVEQVLEVLAQLGSRQALPGEFSFRAVRNGKTTIAAAEAVADLIAAKNHGAVSLAFEKMEGSQSKLMRDLAESLRKLTTMGELGIDFADQDVEELSLPVLKKHAAVVMDKLRTLESSFERGQKIQSGIKTAFVGRPNAGKSSFFNALLGEERSIVSEIAGTTRDVIRESITLQSRVTLRIEDTAGIRKGSFDPIEKIGIERSVRSAREADVILFVAAANETQTEAEETAAVWAELGKPVDRTIAVITKTDAATPAQVAASSERIAKLGLEKIFQVSSTEQTGMRDAVSGIVDFCERFTAREAGEVLLTRLDHLEAVRKTLTHLERALESTAEDLFAADLRQALNTLGPVIGETLPDDILGRIFSEFCIGK